MRTMTSLKPFFHRLTLLWSILILCACRDSQPNEASEQTIATTNPRLMTSDGFSIATQYNLPQVEQGKIPAIILIHQGTSSKNEWLLAARTLAEAGYATLAIDLRGHGQSTPVDDLDELFSDPEQTPKDVLAALDFLRSDNSIDSDRIAIVGASIGGELACVATSQFNIKTAIAISADIRYVNLLHSAPINLKSIFHIGAENDIYQSAQELYNMSQEPKAIFIQKNSSTHGALLFNNSEINAQIMEWLKMHL